MMNWLSYFAIEDLGWLGMWDILQVGRRRSGTYNSKWNYSQTAAL